MMLIIALHYLTDWTWLFVQLQVMLSVAMAITLGWTLQHVGLGLDESSHLRAQLIGLSLGMMGWTLVRKVCQQSPQLAKIVITDMMYADFVIQVIATAVMYVVWHTSMLPPLVGAYGTESVLAGMAVELGHHVNRWDWVLWSLALVAWLSVIPDRHRRTSSMCALIVFSALPILATAQLVESMEHQVEAFPHFLRWGYSLFGIVTAMVVCTDFFWWKRLVARLPRLMDNKEGPERANRGAQTWRLLRIFSLLVATLPVLLLTLLQYVHVIGIYVQGMGGRFEIMSGGVSLFESYPRLAFAGPLWLLMVTYWIHAARTRAVHYLWLSFPFWQCGWMFVGLLSTWMDAEAAHFGDLVHGFNWWLLGQALYGFAWAGLEWRGTQRRGNNTEGAVAKPLELFVGRSASVGFAALSFVLLVVYGAIGVIDGFVLHGGVAMDNWEGEASAFANVEAFLAVLSVIGSLVLWSTVKGYRWQDACTLRPSGKAAVWLSPLSLILLTLLSLVPLVAHLGLSRMSPNADLFRAVSQVLVRQTMGFVLLLGVICTAVVLLLPRWYAASKASSGEMAEGSSSPWKLLDKRLAGVLGVSDLLAILVASSCGMLLLAGTQNDWFVIGLLAFTSLIFVVMAGALQEVRSVGWAILLSLATVALVDFQLANTVPHLANMETKLIEQHLADCWRTEVASLSAIAMLLGLSVSLFRSRTPTVRIPGTVSPSVTWLVGGSVGLLAVGSVWAVVAGLSEDVPSWVGTSREIGNLLVPLVALVLLGRQADFNGWSRLFYTWTVALAAALLAMGMVNPIEPYAVQLNGARILYGVTAFLAAWGMVALQSDRFCEFLSLLGIKDAGRRFEESRLELFWVQASTGGVVLTASFLATFVLPEALMLHRYLVALLPCGLVLGLQIARGTEHENESVGGAVVMVCFSILGILWADLGPGYAIDVWLSRWVRLFIGSSILAVIVSNTVSGLVARWPNHQRLGQWLQMASISVAALSLLCVLGIELVNRSLGGALSTLEVLAVCGGLVFVGWSLLVMAMNPSRDVLALSDTGRQVYVYLSEVIVLLLLGHLWLTRPDWFTIFQNSWPYVLFALAFVGAFVSEYLRRSGIKVLSDPIHNTSFLLPAVPIIGLVLFRDSMVGPAAEYQWYFLLAALVNVVMAFFRKSFLHAMLAALAGNGSLWSAFIGADFAFVDHPQFWLVPPAVSVLIAGQLNRDRLQKHELSFLRYVTISLIYLASSSEMVIKWSVELADIQALATLAGLSLLGVVVGMLYRIRQFVYLGLGFFLLAMGGSIAKVTTYNQLWFWVSLVGLGAVMLVVFAARERYQPILRKKLAEMDSWDQEAESGE
ncbi:MAG: hypothetical protein GY917_19545 [Planctomycetaceae bacterium]|nr:hypothetical protein [Planctomycetaceae bacterium]